ncbi:glycoside hydrolase family 2 TIM barrel-domain containing protein [Persicobacter psychrovividus]
MFSCQQKAQNDYDEISLNGKWKFYTIPGDGSNYMNIRAQQGDVIVDNADSQVVTQGYWKKSTFGSRDTKFYGQDYLQHYFSNTDLESKSKSDSSFVRYYPKLEKSGYFEVFTIFPFSSHMTAQYNIKHAKGTTTKYLSQRVFCGEWNSLGIYEFNMDDTPYIELSAIVSGAVSADAIMLRRVPEAKYLTAMKAHSQIYKVDFKDDNWHDLQVPGHWGMINDYSNYTGIGWYRKAVELPETWEKNDDNRYYLNFGGVYHLSKVYLNGKFIGMNRGGFTPFEFDVTDALNYDGKNQLAVQVDNSAIVGATWNWGGIIRDVVLKKNNSLKIDYQYIHAIPDLDKGTAEVKLKVRLKNRSNRKRSITVHSKLFSEAPIAEMEQAVEVAPNSSLDVALSTHLAKEDVALWHFDHPNLYQFETVISEGNKSLDVKKDDFGIRKIELTDSQMILNGEPVRLAGFNRVSEHRFWGSTEPLSVLEKDLDLMKEAGANFMRIMHGTQNKKLIELCDRKGIMLFEEVNIRDLDNDEFRANYYPVAKLEQEKGLKLKPEQEEILCLDEPYVKLRPEHQIQMKDKNYFLAKYWLKGMIERDINHPSIIGWSVGNELNNHYAYGRDIMNYVKTTLDPYRLLTCVSNSGQKKEYTPATDPNTFVDLIMHNMYTWQGEPQQIINTLREKWPNKPIFISEFGFDPFPSTELDADKEVFSEWINHFRQKNEFVIGTSMWTFNDYRSAYAGTTAEENRVWGVITSWRQKRRLFDRIKKEHAPVLDILVSDIDLKNNNAKVTLPIRGLNDFPTHSMKGYQLTYELKNIEGTTISTNSINLPLLKPGDHDWASEISWKALDEEPLDLKVSLVSPTKYSRLDKTISFQPAITPDIKEILQGKNELRVLFDQVPNATAYFVEYTDSEGNRSQTHKTISNYIDIKGLKENSKYRLELFAFNDKEISKPSKVMISETNNKTLPPNIWDNFIADNKLVIGYSSDFTDGDYTVLYGTTKDKLVNSFTSNVRGMMSIDLDHQKQIYYKIKRITPFGESNWSNIVKIEE